MKKIGIFYGSTTGTTEAVAEQIASHLGGGSSEVYNVGNTDAKVAEEYELLILGSSTWGSGELQINRTISIHSFFPKNKFSRWVLMGQISYSRPDFSNLCMAKDSSVLSIVHNAMYRIPFCNS